MWSRLAGLYYLPFPFVSTSLVSLIEVKDRFEDTSLGGRDLLCFFVALYRVLLLAMFTDCVSLIVYRSMPDI